MENWKALSIPEVSRINDAINQLHRAAQFVAMFGNAYLPKKEDDSQNCLYWNSRLNRLEGSWTNDPKMRMALDVISFELMVERSDHTERISLHNKTKAEVYGTLLDLLQKSELDTLQYEPIKQFTIPHHPIEDGQPFRKPENELLEEWPLYLSNTQLILRKIARRFGGTTEIFVWPHHFDLAIQVPLSLGENETKSVGMGLAIADTYSEEPYFYINNLDPKPTEYDDQIPGNGKAHWNIRDWSGLVLPAGAVANEPSDRQENQLKSFFMTAWMHHHQFIGNI